MGYESFDIKERTDTGIPEIEAVLATAYAAAKKQDIEIEIITRKLYTESNTQIYDLLKVVNNICGLRIR
ncbi:MAG: hypothetical protein LRZ93_01240 [Clostridiales bacterium]|nr:hypothetical protein [Clostridiales bacterium]